jgi:integrase
MPAQKGLTAAVLNAAKPGDKPFKLYDRDRLYVLISVAGSKRWAWAYRLDGKDHTLQLGRYPDVSIIDARKARAAAAKHVESGQHPGEVKKETIAAVKKEQANSFGPIAAEWIDANRKTWSPWYLQQVETFLTRYAINGDLGAMPIRAITVPDVVRMLKGVAEGKTRTGEERKKGSPTVAILLRQWCSAVFRYAILDGRADRNPVSDLKASDVIKRAPVKNNLALSPAEFRKLLSALPGYGGNRVTKIAIELLALFFVRTGELRQAEWKEFDFDARQWTVPAVRMKKKNVGDHIVPLSDQAIALLTELKAITGTAKIGRDWLFRNTRRPAECMSATTVNRALEGMGFNGSASIGFSAHGFRGTASTLLHEQGFKPEVIEVQLAHTEKNPVKKAYNKARYLTERVALMQSWSDYVGGLKSDVSADSGEPATV